MARKTLHQVLDEIVDRIRTRNLQNRDEPLPVSDSMYRSMMSDLVDSARTLRSYIETLVESHHIFVIKITEPDPRLGMEGVDGYVVADPVVLETAREICDKNLERIYESQFRKSSSSSTIIHELFPKISNYKNTPLGQALNISVMLQQYQQIIKEEPENYTTEWKNSRLSELLHESTDMDDMSGSEEEVFDEESLEGMRATDSKVYQEMETMDLSGTWGQAYQRYGGQFLMRVHIRRNEYGLLKNLIKQKRIAKEEDLRFLRDTLRNMETRRDPTDDIVKHRSEIVDLRRAAQLKLNQIKLAREGRL